MATTFPGTYKGYYPIDPRMAASPGRVGFTTGTGLTTPKYLAVAGEVWFPARSGTKTIENIWFNLTGADAGTGSPGNTTLRVSLQDLSSGSFGPDGTADSQRFLLSADVLSGWQKTAAYGYSISFGQKICVVFDYDGSGFLGAGDRVQLYGFQFYGGTSTHGFPWLAVRILSTANWIHQGVVPNIIFEFSDGTFGLFSGSTPITTKSFLTYGQLDDPNEIGVQFRVPWDCQVDALWFSGACSGDAETNTTTIVLSDAVSGDAVASVEIDEAEMSESSRLQIYPLSEAVALSAGANYVVSVRPNNNANNVTLNYLVLHDEDWRPLVGGDANMGYVDRGPLDSGWSAVSGTSIPICGVRLCGFGAGAALALPMDAGSYAVSGFAATLTRTRKLVADSGSYLVTGFDTVLSQSTKIILSDLGLYAVSGFAATLAYHRTMSLAAGSYAVTGGVANFALGARLELSAGSYTWTGFAATLEKDSFLELATGSYTVDGFVADFTAEGATTYQLELETGSYAVTGSDATLLADREVSLDAGGYTVLGFIADLAFDHALSLVAGEYAVSGSDATLLANRELVVEHGQYLTEGFLAFFEITEDSTSTCRRSSAVYVSSPWRPILPTPDATVGAHDRRWAAYYYCADLQPSLLAESGSYVVTGSDATFLRGYHLELASGVYNTVGVAADLAYEYLLSLDAGSYALTGSDATILADWLLSLDAGSYTYTGSDAVLDSTAATSFVIIAETGSYAVTGFDATFLRDRVMTLEPGSYEVTGFDTEPFVFQAAWVAGKTILIDEILEQ